MPLGAPSGIRNPIHHVKNNRCDHGFFTADSYPNYSSIPTYSSPSTSTKYDLRDCLDFRPVRKSGQSTFELEYKLSTSSTNYGFLIPSDLTQFKSSYSYYLPRKDLLVLSKDKNFQIIEGVSSVNPIFPVQPEGSLLISKINLDPYTAYIPGENPIGTLPNLSLLPVLHKRWTMQDISDLSSRINNS
mgnify:CR=1 FL=1